MGKVRLQALVADTPISAIQSVLTADIMRYSIIMKRESQFWYRASCSQKKFVFGFPCL